MRSCVRGRSLSSSGSRLGSSFLSGKFDMVFCNFGSREFVGEEVEVFLSDC